MAAVPTIGRATGVERRPAAPEADATRALYERYSRQILNYCVHQLNSREEAEDAVQTTFMNAFRGLKRGVVPEAEQAWLFKIAENVCLSRRRSSWRRGKVESPNDFEVLQEIVPSKHANRADELIGLEDALEAMPENQRRAILLREWQGLSYREIADELELSQAAVETLIFRARRSLANGLESPAPAKKRRGRISGATDGVSLGSLLASLKSILSGGAAIKAVAVAVAAGSATVAATQAEPTLVHHLRHASKPAASVHVTKQSRAVFNAPAAIIAGQTGMSVTQAAAKTARGTSLHDAISAAPLANGRGHTRTALVPTDDATHTSAPPVTPGVPSAPAPSAPSTPNAPAPEAPIAAAPTPVAPAVPTEQPKTEPSSPGKSGNGNDGKGGSKTEAPKSEPTKTEPAKPTDNGNGNGKSTDDTKSKDAGATTTKSATPATEPAPTTGKSDNGDSKDKGDKSKADTPKQVSTPTPAAPTVPAPPAAPAAPAAAQSNNGNSDKDKGDKGGDKGKSDKPAPAPPAPAPAAPAAPVAAAPAAPPATTTATTPAPPPTQPTNPPMHGNGNGGADSKDKGDKGKGK